jgi:hypothetical protein
MILTIGSLYTHKKNGSIYKITTWALDKTRDIELIGYVQVYFLQKYSAHLGGWTQLRTVRKGKGYGFYVRTAEDFKAKLRPTTKEDIVKNTR